MFEKVKQRLRLGVKREKTEVYFMYKLEYMQSFFAAWEGVSSYI